MWRRLIYFFILGLILLPAATASAALPDMWTSRDIGDEGLPGTADEAAGVWTVVGSGQDIGGDADDFHYCCTPIRGDTKIVARVVGIAGGTDEWRKAGIMIRETLADNSSHAFMAMTNPAGTEHAAAYQSRADGINNITHLIPADYTAMPWWVKLERIGNNFTGSASPDGVTWTAVDTTEIVMSSDVYVGLAVTSHDNAEIATGTFDSVFIHCPWWPPPCRARLPSPESGSLVGPEYDGDNVYVFLHFLPGACTYGHWSQGYFSDNKADVDDRDPAHSLGAIPFWPDVEHAFLVGYDDPSVAEFARTPLVPGTTYYWCVDSWDGTQYWPGTTWSFTPIPPNTWNPSPEDGEHWIPNDGTMTWNLGTLDPTGKTLTYDVYIGTDEAAVASVATNSTASPLYAGNVSTESYDYNYLSMGTEYFWRVDTVLGLSHPPFTRTYYTGDVWSFTTVPLIPPPPLIGWWKLDGDLVPGLAFDYSGWGHHGTLMGNPTFVPGIVDNALALDGVDDCVEIGSVGISGNEPRTIVGWVKAATTDIPPWTNVFGFTGPGGEGTYFDIEVVGDTNSTTAGCYGINFNGDAYNLAPLDLEWHCLAVTFDGTEARLYADIFFRCFGMPIIIHNPVPTVSINTADNVHIGKRHDNDNHFPGLIDDVRIYDRPLSLKEIRILTGPLNAACPEPGNHWTNVETNPTLMWTPGLFAAETDGSILYYSEDRDAVQNRTVSGTPVSTSSFTLPMPLDIGKTFYWAVDTVNGIETWPGDLWEFTTINWLSVDDMESYSSWVLENPIWKTWRDGFGDCQPGSGNDTGANLTIENGIVLDGSQSTQYDYDNDGTAFNPCTLEQGPRPHLYSKIEAQVADLASGIGSDWTISGVRALSLNFYGETDNDTTEPLWVRLKDSTKAYGQKVFYGHYPGEDINDINEPSWHEWNIDLADFAVDLNDVVSIVIGIGNEGSDEPGGSGTLYFDDIRLYTPRCVPPRRSPEFARVDWKEDCQIDYGDLKILADVWLETDLPEPGKAQGDGPISFINYAELIKSWLNTEEWP